MNKYESAKLILELYDLRREETMRKARNWFFGFNPSSVEDIEKTMMDPEVGAYLRMVLSYWDMAAALVNSGAIDAELFSQTNGEHVGVFTKVEPFIAELREKWQSPEAFQNLEKVILDRPDGAEQIQKNREFMKFIQEKMAGGQSSEASA
ncbi:MAG TPA: DUF4760 domain-containing protein [Pyrinomonadaceae bacterium]|nr:DUF4760 domain-containing protein [Pyrinomonadaceae bacterium]